MKRNAFYLGAILSVVGVTSLGCSSDKTSSGDTSGSGGTSDSGAGGSGGSGVGGKGQGGNAQGGKGQGGNAQGGKGQGGNAQGGNSGAAQGGKPQMDAGSGGNADSGQEAGTMDAGSDSGGIVDAGSGARMIARGAYLVRTVAQCGGCHTPAGGAELSGNPTFGGLPTGTPNLTPDPTGLGNWTDDQIKNAFRNGIDDGGRHLSSAMPYWLFHNLSDADADAIVAFLRSLTPVSTPNDSGVDNPDAAQVTPLDLAAFPDTTLATTDANYAAAETGRYLVSSIAQCVKCHSPRAATGLPAQSYFSGVAQTTLPPTKIFAPNITPDTTGIAGWTAADVVTALKTGVNKAGTTLCGSMPSAAKGYGNLTDADATAIGIYLTTIPAVSNSAADPSLEPACP